MNKIKKNDNVMVITGKDKGRTGSVLRIVKKKSNPKAGYFAVVQGINMVKKHQKPKPHSNPEKQQPGGLVSKEMPLPISNVALLNPKTNKIGKVGFKTLEDGKKVRYFKESGEVIDV